jgi:hypothetical protein
LFLQAQVGVATTTFAGPTASHQSGGGVLTLSIGGSVSPNVVLFGTLFGRSAGNFPVASGPSSAPVVVNTTATIAGLGVGGAYCFLAADACLSAVVASVGASYSGPYGDGRTKIQSNNAAGFRAALTKEWWMARHFAIGVGADFMITGTMRVSADTGTFIPPEYSATSFALLGSATFN